jgi:hypothetical protein
MRSRIHERLARATQFPVTLIVAPAGFGKTVALRDFIATARLDVLRYDVPREDNTLLAFARGLANTLNVPANALDATTPVATIAELFVAHLRRVVTTIVSGATTIRTTRCKAARRSGSSTKWFNASWEQRLKRFDPLPLPSVVG